MQSEDSILEEILAGKRKVLSLQDIIKQKREPVKQTPQQLNPTLSLFDTLKTTNKTMINPINMMSITNILKHINRIASNIKGRKKSSLVKREMSSLILEALNPFQSDKILECLWKIKEQCHAENSNELNEILLESMVNSAFYLMNTGLSEEKLEEFFDKTKFKMPRFEVIKSEKINLDDDDEELDIDALLGE